MRQHGIMLSVDSVLVCVNIFFIFHFFFWTSSTPLHLVLVSQELKWIIIVFIWWNWIKSFQSLISIIFFQGRGVRYGDLTGIQYLLGYSHSHALGIMYGRSNSSSLHIYTKYLLVWLGFPTQQGLFINP